MANSYELENDVPSWLSEDSANSTKKAVKPATLKDKIGNMRLAVNNFIVEDYTESSIIPSIEELGEAKKQKLISPIEHDLFRALKEGSREFNGDRYIHTNNMKPVVERMDIIIGGIIKDKEVSMKDFDHINDDEIANSINGNTAKAIIIATKLAKIKRNSPAFKNLSRKINSTLDKAQKEKIKAVEKESKYRIKEVVRDHRTGEILSENELFTTGKEDLAQEELEKLTSRYDVDMTNMTIKDIQFELVEKQGDEFVTLDTVNSKENENMIIDYLLKETNNSYSYDNLRKMELLTDQDFLMEFKKTFSKYERQSDNYTEREIFLGSINEAYRNFNQMKDNYNKHINDMFFEGEGRSDKAPAIPEAKFRTNDRINVKVEFVDKINKEQLEENTKNLKKFVSKVEKNIPELDTIKSLVDKHDLKTLSIVKDKDINSIGKIYVPKGKISAPFTTYPGIENASREAMASYISEYIVANSTKSDLAGTIQRTKYEMSDFEEALIETKVIEAFDKSTDKKVVNKAATMLRYDQPDKGAIVRITPSKVKQMSSKLTTRKSEENYITNTLDKLDILTTKDPNDKLKVMAKLLNKDDILDRINAERMDFRQFSYLNKDIDHRMLHPLDASKDADKKALKTQKYMDEKYADIDLLME